MNRLVSIFLVLLVLSGIVFLAWYTAKPDETALKPSVDTGESVTIEDDRFGLGGIETIPFEGIAPDEREIDVTEQRDDRIIIPISTPQVSQSDESTVLADQQAVSERLPRLTRLFAGQVAGYRLDQEDGSLVVKLVEAGTGSRYRIATDPYRLSLVSPGEVRKVVEGYLFANDTVLLLYEGDDEFVIKSAFVPFDVFASSERLLQFEDNIRVATDYENQFFYTRRVNDTTVGIAVDVENPDDTTVIWQSGFSHWLPRWGRNPFITIATPISSQARGKVYLLDPAGQEPFRRAIEPVFGGSAFVDAYSGYIVLYETEKDAFAGKTVVTDLTRDRVISLPITLPEKCDGFNGIFLCAVPEEIPYETRSGHETVFPDSWYQGDISFVDVVLRVNTTTGEVRQVMSQDETDIRLLSDGEIFDIIHPRISDSGEYLFFVNKNNLSLWMLRLL